MRKSKRPKLVGYYKSSMYPSEREKVYSGSKGGLFINKRVPRRKNKRYINGNAKKNIKRN